MRVDLPEKNENKVKYWYVDPVRCHDDIHSITYSQTMWLAFLGVFFESCANG